VYKPASVALAAASADPPLLVHIQLQWSLAGARPRRLISRRGGVWARACEVGLPSRGFLSENTTRPPGKPAGKSPTRCPIRQTFPGLGKRKELTLRYVSADLRNQHETTSHSAVIARLAPCSATDVCIIFARGPRRNSEDNRRAHPVNLNSEDLRLTRHHARTDDYPGTSPKCPKRATRSSWLDETAERHPYGDPAPARQSDFVKTD